MVGEFLTRPNPAVIATLRPDGFPHTAATWYVWEDGRVLVNMDATRRRLEPFGVRFIHASPAQTSKFLDAEIKRWGEMVRALNLSVD